MPRVMRPQLATTAARVPEGEGWLQELKYDGYRIVAFVAGSDVRLVTRNGNDWTDRFPSVRDALAKLGWKSAVVDGEIVAETAEGGMSFQSLQNALRSRGKPPNIGYYLFDLPYFGGYDLAAAPLVQRKEVLRSLLAGVPQDSRLRFSDHITGGGRDFLQFACRSAMEGVVCKKADGRYREGRSRDWLKVKCINRQEFVIGGFTDPAGSRVGFGALLLGYYEADGELRYCGRVGTGFDRRALRQLATMLKKAERKKTPFLNPPRGSFHWTEPRLVAEVEFKEWTANGMLRQPSFEGLREDKEAADVRKEQPSARPATKVKNPRGKGVATNVVAGVRLTNPDRVVYPEQGITKRELAEYYVAVADLMLPHVADRPLMVVRCPKGSGDACFYQKHVTETLPKAVRALEVEEEEGTAPYIAVHGVDGLVSLVQMGVLEFHPWGSRGANLERPDRMIFDLDPAEGVEWARVVASARRLRDVMKSLRLASFVRTTGGKGLHVVVPLA